MNDLLQRFFFVFLAPHFGSAEAALALETLDAVATPRARSRPIASGASQSCSTDSRVVSQQSIRGSTA
jgi:hypothetical protein